MTISWIILQKNRSTKWQPLNATIWAQFVNYAAATLLPGEDFAYPGSIIICTADLLTGQMKWHRSLRVALQFICKDKVVQPCKCAIKIIRKGHGGFLTPFIFNNYDMSEQSKAMWNNRQSTGKCGFHGTKQNMRISINPCFFSREHLSESAIRK